MIHIIKDYYIDSDPHNFILCKWSGKRDKKGNPVIKNQQYYSTWEGMTRGLETSLMREALGEASCLGHLESICTGLRYELQQCMETAFSGLQEG